MKILVTGSAGFIGSALSIRLLQRGDTVIGIDNHNDYYDTSLKEDRLNLFIDNDKYSHNRISLEDYKSVKNIFKKEKIDVVVNLAAQAGVRYSLENPVSYVNSNILGFTHLLEECRYNNVNHLVYASTSSVYGLNTKMPYSVKDSANHPVSFYAATKKANELMAHTYSHLYKLPTTGLRFFTVYGPWGRPDMALFKFTNSILKKERITIFNNGKHKRDFTYIDDIISGIEHVIDNPPSGNKKWSGNDPEANSSTAPWRIFNIGNNKKTDLMDYISEIEKELEMNADKEFLPLQLGDVPDTHADVEELISEFNYKPNTSIKDGIKEFIKWYKIYYKINQ